MRMPLSLPKENDLCKLNRFLVSKLEKLDKEALDARTDETVC